MDFPPARGFTILILVGLFVRMVYTGYGRSYSIEQDFQPATDSVNPCMMQKALEHLQVSTVDLSLRMGSEAPEIKTLGPSIQCSTGPCIVYVGLSQLEAVDSVFRSCKWHGYSSFTDENIGTYEALLDVYHGNRVILVYDSS